MSAEEFAEWSVMFTAEELHPAADRMRHAQLLAAMQNGQLTRKSKKLWTAGDFMRDPWAPAPVKKTLSPAQVAAQVASFNASRRSRDGK
jgi:hypothetical protein